MMFFILITLNCIIQVFQFCNTFGVLKDKGGKCFSFISDLQKGGKDVLCIYFLFKYVFVFVACGEERDNF